MEKKQTPTIGIIGGKGRMGKIFADFFKERGVKVLVADLKTKLTKEELVSKSDITIVSVPIDKTVELIESIVPLMPAHAALMDFTSLKVQPLKAMMKAKCEVLGLHPMFGDSNPIPGQTVILTPTKKSGHWTKWLTDFLRANEVEIYSMSAKKHDEMMTVAQAMIHFADIAFADGLRRSKVPVETLTQFAGKASELKVLLAARLLHQDPNLYGNIQIQNPRTLKVLKNYQKSIGKLIEIVAKKDLKKFTRYFQLNQKFLGKYQEQAFNETNYLIDKLVERRHRPSATVTPKPSKKSLAILGPAHTFSDAAATHYLAANGLGHPKYYAQNIGEIFQLVSKGEVALGLAPIENKVQGTVRESHDALFEENVHIVDELEIGIEHCLITLKHSKARQITKIISHPQALSQCRQYLQKNFPKAVLEPYSSTAAALQKMKSNRKSNIAVIASEIAANNDNKLKVLEKNIEDVAHNSTRFIVLKKGKFKPKDVVTTAGKTSIVFHFGKNKPGTLHGVLAEFAKAKVDLSKIESRPTRGKFGEYIFFVDFQEAITSPKAQKVLKSIEDKVANLKILGSY